MTSACGIRKLMVFFALLFFSVLGAFSDDALPQLTFTSESGMAFVYGKAEEIVYKSTSGTDLLSLLVYPIPPSLGAYIDMEARWRDSLLARIKLETVWPLTSGNLTDDDWIYVSSVSDDPDVHSDSEAYLTSWIRGDFEIGTPENKPPFLVETLFGLTYMQMTWEGWDALQDPGTVDFPDGVISGYVIDYRQTWLIPWIGLSVGHQKPVSIFMASIRFSPWMYVVGRDVHMARPIPTTYIDMMSGGIMISGSLSGEFGLADNFWLVSRLSLDHCSGSRGDTIAYEVGDLNMDRYANTGGAAMNLFSMYLGFSVHP
ncbi:MAG: omptin family outer membrane protease [Spirochaetia bacterium]|nr:omptin family outer membrane protease [Spirochaetia bacterium]